MCLDHEALTDPGPADVILQQQPGLDPRVERLLAARRDKNVRESRVKLRRGGVLHLAVGESSVILLHPPLYL